MLTLVISNMEIHSLHFSHDTCDTSNALEDKGLAQESKVGQMRVEADVDASSFLPKFYELIGGFKLATFRSHACFL